MQAVPASPISPLQTTRKTDAQDASGERLPSQENGEQRISGGQNAAGEGMTTSLPGIRDLFPDHLFEAQQRREPLDDLRARQARDPFLPSSSAFRTDTRTDADREMRRKAFAALTEPFPQTRMESRSPYAVRNTFTFPGPSSTSRLPSSPARPPIPSALASSPSTILSSPLSNRTEPIRPRAHGHAHTHSSDASAAAAGLLGLSLSGGPSSSTEDVGQPPLLNAFYGHATNEREKRRPEGAADRDKAMFVYEMDEALDRVRDRGRSRERSRGEGMDLDSEGPQRVLTNADSELDKPRKDSIPSVESSLESTSVERQINGTADPSSSAENDNSGDRDPTSSAENDGTEEGGDGEGEGEGEGGDGKRHTCPHCKKRFNRPSSLKIHLNTHTGAKPFECPYPGCGRQFNVSSNMRRHYRNHSSPAGLGSGAHPGMGMGMGMHDQFAPRPPPGVLGLHMGPPGYPGPQHAHRQAQMQMEREMERERIERERMSMSYGPPHGAPSSYRPPPHSNGVSIPPPHPARVPSQPNATHGVPYGSYPPSFGPRDPELERRDRLQKERIMQMEWENYKLRQRERERFGREREKLPPGYSPQAHPPVYHNNRPYAQYSPPQRDGRLDFRMVGDRPDVIYNYHAQAHAQGDPSSYAHQASQPPYSQHQSRPPVAAPVTPLRSSHSFSYSYNAPQALPYARSSQSQSRSRERYSAGTGSPVPSPRLSSASSVPVAGWRGHSHTHSAPAFPGSERQRVEYLPPVPSLRPPVDIDGRRRSGHERSLSYSVASTRSGPISPASLAQSSTFSADGERRTQRRARRDSTDARTGHESENEGMSGSPSDAEKHVDSDIDMVDNAADEREVLGDLEVDEDMKKSAPGSAATVTGAGTWHQGGTEGAQAISAVAKSSSSPVQVLSPSLSQRTPPAHTMELRTRANHPQAVPLRNSPSVRDRGYSGSQSSYSHSRTGSNSSSGHGHDFVSHPYARARHAHSRSREAAVIAAEMGSPKLHSSSSTSPRPPLPILSASVSSFTSGSTTSISSSRQNQNGAVSTLHMTRQSPESPRNSKTTSPISPTGSSARYPVYTFPPPAPPPGIVSSSSPVGSQRMEVEN